MSEKIQTVEKGEKQERKGRRARGTSPHGVQEKCRAVLALWTGTRRPCEICREYAIPYSLLTHWERRALEGMVQALTPRVALTRGPGLSPRLQVVLEKRLKRLQKASLGAPAQASSPNASEKMTS